MKKIRIIVFILVLVVAFISCSKSSGRDLQFTVTNLINNKDELWIKVKGMPKFDPMIHSDGCSGGMSALYSRLTFLHKQHGKTLQWRRCCEIHDLAYYYGGSKFEKRRADAALSECVTQVVGNEFIGKAMQAAVEIGGGPNLPTSYRWGYGADFKQ